jgi:Tol biopolymer transport system component
MTTIDHLQSALGARYRIERELGQGGMATVYLAEDLKHHRQVAIKVLRHELAVSVGPARFTQEIEIAARLQHPHILPLLDSGNEGGVLYYVMPYVDGESLRERLTREGELPVPEAVRLLSEIADALTHAHAQGVVHRDIKPENVMVLGRHALVMDFGVAKALSDATAQNRITTAGVALGTPAYMAPEQATADTHLDHRVDIYALGVVGYELLTGRTPFGGGSAQQVLAAQVTQAPEPVTTHRSTVSPALQHVIMRCLAKRPADRWQSSDEVLAELEKLMTPTEGITPAETRPSSAVQRERRRIWWGVGMATLVLLGVGGGWALLARKPAQQAPVAYDVAQLTTSGQASNPVISPDGQQVAYMLRQCGDDGRCKSGIMVREIATGVERPIVADLPFAVPVQWSPSGLWLVILAVDEKNNRAGEFTVSRLGGPLMFLGGSATFLPNGDSVLVASRERGSNVMYLRRAPVSGQPTDSVAVIPPPGVQRLQGMNVSPSNRWIIIPWATQGPDWLLALYDRAGKLADTVSVPLKRFPLPRWAPGSDAIFTSVRSGQDEGALLRIAVNPMTGRFGRKDTVVVAPGINLLAFDIPPSGRSMVYDAARQGASELWTLSRDRAGAVPQTIRRVRTASAAFGAYLSRDGRQIIFSSTDRTQGPVRMQYFVTGFDSGDARALTPELADVVSENPTLDFRSFIVATRDSPLHSQLTAYDVVTGQSTHFTDEPFNGLGVMEGGADGVSVITAPGDSVRVLDHSGREMRRFGIPDSLGQVGNFAISPDGSELAFVTTPRTVPGGVPNQFIMHLYRLSLATGQIRTVSHFPLIITPRTMKWTDDGWIHMELVTLTDDRDVLYRVRADGGQFQLENALPFPRNSFCDMSGDGKRWICEVTHEISDLYLIRNFQAAAVR